MARMLLVEDDPVFCDVVAERLKCCAFGEFKYALTGTLGAKMMIGGRFDIAMINATLPDTSGIELAKLAVNEDISVLMLSENPCISARLKQLDYRYLERPFSFNLLASEVQNVLLEHECLNRCRTAASGMEAKFLALQAEVAESHRLFDAIIAHLGYLKS